MKSRLFFITYTAANVGLIIYGIMALVQPDILLEPFFVHVYQFPPEATFAVAYLAGLYRLLGYFNIIPGLLGLLILYRYWLIRKVWHLKMVIVFTILSYLGPVIFDNTIGSIGFFEILEHILLAIILITGFIILINGNSKTYQEISTSNSIKSAPEEIKHSYFKSHNPASKVYPVSER